ncbi:MAG: hypothetical protein WC613_04595 [Candidatus Aenigmatarchaeota archaeon]
MAKYVLSENPVHGIKPEVMLQQGAHGMLNHVDIYEDLSVLHISGESSGHVVTGIQDRQMKNFRLADCDQHVLQELASMYGVPIIDLQEAQAVEKEYRARRPTS